MSRRVGVYFNFIFFLFTSTTRWDELNAWLWCPWNTLPKLWKSWFLSQMFRLSGWANMVTKKICIKINNAWFFFCTLTVVGINLIKKSLFSFLYRAFASYAFTNVCFNSMTARYLACVTNENSKYILLNIAVYWIY